jgi:hypothetical protein
MSDAMSFAELDGQHVELLPSRTVLSLIAMTGDGGTATGGNGGTNNGNNTGGNGGTGGAGGAATGGPGLIILPINYGSGSQTNSAGNAVGGHGGNSVGGSAFGGANGGSAPGANGGLNFHLKDFLNSWGF